MNVDDLDDARLRGLAPRFLQALEARERGDVDGARDLLEEVLRAEPRLAEPRLELARLLLDQGQLDEAEEHAREALRVLESGGQWTDDLPEAVVLSIAHDIVGEVLRQKADADEVVFGDAARYRVLVLEARDHFTKASLLDKDNEHARHWARALIIPPEA